MKDLRMDIVRIEINSSQVTGNKRLVWGNRRKHSFLKNKSYYSRIILIKIGYERLDWISSYTIFKATAYLGHRKFQLLI